MKVYLNTSGLVTTDPHDPKMCGLWPETIPRLLKAEGVEFFIGTFEMNFPLERKDIEFLEKTVCRDETLMALSMELIASWRKLPVRHLMPKDISNVVERITQHMRHKGRTI